MGPYDVRKLDLTLEAVLLPFIRAKDFIFRPSQRTLDKRLADAVFRGQEKIALYTLGHGASPNVRDRDGEPVLHMAAGDTLSGQDGLFNIAAALIKAKADIHATDTFGLTARAMAGYKGNAKIAAELEKSGAVPGFGTPGKNT